MNDIWRVLRVLAPSAREGELRASGFSPSQACWLVHMRLLYRHGFSTTTAVRPGLATGTPPGVDDQEKGVIAYGTLTTCLFREFFVREGLCDSQRARVLAGKLDHELQQTDEIETEDGATLIKVQRCRQARLAVRQLGFGAFGGDIDERHPNRVDPVTLTSRLDHCA